MYSLTHPAIGYSTKAAKSSRRIFRPLFYLLLPLLFCLQLAAQSAPDADMYYRRTHGGQAPPPGINTSDHSGETVDVVPAPSRLMPAQQLNPQAPTESLANGVDPNNLGKGDWIWQIPTTQTHLGVSSVQGIIDYEVGKGMKWITVKCGDGTGIWSQFTADLVNRAHAAGLKIFGWAYVYGSNPTGEANVAINCLNLGADGFIIDAEGEYEVLANNSAAAAQFCQAIRAAYPDKFLAHAPFPYIQSHAGFPYVTFGVYCDAVMPQDYWGAIGISPATMVVNMDSKWKTWQNGLTGTNRNAIKPIVPLGQSYAPVTGAEITTFANGIINDASPATTGGYHGISFWDAQERTADMDSAVAAIVIGSSAPTISTQPSNRSVDQGNNLIITVGVSGNIPLRYQWLRSGTNISAGTLNTYTMNNIQPTSSGLYSVIITNSLGAITSSVATIVVNSTSVWRTVYLDNLDSDTSVNWNLFQGSQNNVSDYTATWAFDYTASIYTNNGVAQTIPVAPSTTNGVKHGLKLTVNKDATGAASGVSLYPKSQSFSGNYALRFDMWINYNGGAGGGSGSTEYGTFGLNFAGTRVNWATNNASASDGIWFAVDGEGGSGGSDYRAYLGTGGVPTQLSVAASGLKANGALTDNVSDPFFQSLFPSPTYETTGVPGKHWVQGEVSQINGVITWRLNGTVVAQRTNTSSYTSGNVMIGYMDVYSSIASPPQENYIIFDNVRVLVPAVLPAISAQPQNQTVIQGNSTSFSVAATGDNPLSYQWQLNGTNINGATGTNYILSSAQASDAGTYSVVVSNPSGAVTSSNAVLTVNLPPTITTQPVSKNANQGANVVLQALATGSPTLAYQWQRSGTNIAGATTGNFVIHSIQSDQADMYWVVVTNNYGSVTSAVATVTVNVPPTITTQPQSQSVAVGANANFTVGVSGTAPFTYQWSFNGAPIGGATSSSYTRTGVQTNDAGNYSVVVSNMVSWVFSTNALLTVTQATQPAQFQSINELPDGTINLSLSGELGSHYALDGSSNLVDWIEITNFANSNGTYQFNDGSSTNSSLRFYRARLIP
ncbi:MAG: hypothetical protein JWQ71_1566 [Pedosphaera sp.]|nr:hypothetical protein [Pedosphaera sp.]